LKPDKKQQEPRATVVRRVTLTLTLTLILFGQPRSHRLIRHTTSDFRLQGWTYFTGAYLLLQQCLNIENTILVEQVVTSYSILDGNA
jgi:hypothetical protein